MIFINKVEPPTVLLVDADSRQCLESKSELESQGYRSCKSRLCCSIMTTSAMNTATLNFNFAGGFYVDNQLVSP